MTSAQDMRRQILAVDDPKIQDILFSLLGYVHELAERQPVQNDWGKP